VGFARSCGRLLLERAYRRGDTADAEEAATLLPDATVEAVDDHPAQAWYDLGTAYQAW
jgi:hypothetical protein